MEDWTMFDLSWLNMVSLENFLPQLLSAGGIGIMEKPPDAIDFGMFGWIAFNWTFFSAVLQIILIDLVLAGDNAVVIALAVRNLPPKQKKWGIILGAGAAVVLRIICTAFVSQMLRVPLLKFVGGCLIAWIAVKLMTQGHEEEKVDSASNLMEAVKLIVIADFVMSLDNMLAVGGASGGNIFLLLFGLIVSIPFVVGTSQLLSMLMDKYPIIVTIGSAVLGKVAGELIITDPWVSKWVSGAFFGGAPLPSWLIYTVDIIFVIGVVGVGKWLVKRKKAEAEKATGKVLSDSVK
jgi:YjbE family integral membrane protein